VAIYLGIDGGGSKTSCLIGDETSVLGTGTAGGSNVVRVGEAQARESLAIAIHQACTVANVQPSQITKVCVGLAGAARSEVSQPVRTMISEILSGDGTPHSTDPDEITVVGDMVIALEAAFGDGPGVIVIAGTGSIAYGRSRDGQIASGLRCRRALRCPYQGRRVRQSRFGAFEPNDRAQRCRADQNER